MEYSGLALFPIPALVRRRLPRPSSSQAVSKIAKSSGDQHNGLKPSSEPRLLCDGDLSASVVPELQKPSTAIKDLDSFEFGSVGSDTAREEMGSMTKYETASGLRWNRVVPGEPSLTSYMKLFIPPLSLTFVKRSIFSAMRDLKLSSRRLTAVWLDLFILTLWSIFSMLCLPI